VSLISVVVAKDISQWMEKKIEAENEEEVGIAYQAYENSHMFPSLDKNGVIQGPDFKLMVKQEPQQMESMPFYYPGMGNMGMPNMGMPNMGMPNMGMSNMYPGYPGNYQSMTRTNACGCSSSCGMPCFWWSCNPCVPCPPCNQPTEPTTIQPTTTTTLVTTTPSTLPTFPQEVPTQETTSNPCPCPPVCPPCMPWFPCRPCVPSCPCQTTTTGPQNTPTTTLTTTVIF
jgi:hypothetical protein